MTLVEKHPRQKGLYCIIMMHALLKSELLLSRDLIKTAIDILKESLIEEYYDTTSTLNEEIQEKPKKLRTIKDR